MNKLKEFYIDVAMRETVKEFIIDSLKDMAIERAFKKMPVDGIAEARDALEDALNRLDGMFGEKKKIDIINTR